jgi:hypothetical protein
MAKNQCSLSLHDIRDDMSTLASAVAPIYASVYFDEEMASPIIGVVNRPVQTEQRVRASNVFQPQLGYGRCVRRKAARDEYLPPRSAAEEKRQLLAVLRQSMQDSVARSEKKPTEIEVADRGSSIGRRGVLGSIERNLLTTHSPLESLIPANVLTVQF